MKACSLEVIIFDVHTIDHGRVPAWQLFFLNFVFVVAFLFFVVVIFVVEKTCFIITRALLSAFFLNVRRLASICKYNYMK